MNNNLLALNRLRVFTTHTDFYNEETKHWRQSRAVFSPESCSEQLWVGLDTHFADFPAQKGRSEKLLAGEEAYKRLIEWITGLRSHKGKIDTHNTYQFKKSWDRFTQEASEQAQEMSDVINILRSDARLITAQILDQVIPPSHINSCRRLADPQKGDRILLLGDMNRNQSLSRYTEDIIKTMANMTSKPPSAIVIMHPDPVKAQYIYDSVCQLAKERRFNTDIVLKSYDEHISRELDHADHVFVDIPMGQDPDFDIQLISAWQTRVKTDNKLIHMRGDPTQRGLSSGIWLQKNPELSGFISPEEIRAKTLSTNENNKQLLVLAREAITYFAQLRFHDHSTSPSKGRLKGFINAQEAAPSPRFS